MRRSRLTVSREARTRRAEDIASSHTVKLARNVSDSLNLFLSLSGKMHMTAVDTEPRVSADTLPDLASAAITAMVERLRGSVVQVRGNGRGGGAGVIWRAGGAVLTNHHVVAANGDDPHVILADGRRLAARLVASNPTLDLALLQVEADGLPAAPAGDSSRLRVGELVFAIGHPWGQRGVVTAGIISGLGIVGGSRGEWQAQYVRSDVRLAPGNSGGPLLNTRGEVVGVNTAISSLRGGFEGVGYAVPSRVVARIVPALIREGHYDHPWIGISMVGLDPLLAQRFGLEVSDGVLVTGVQEGSPGDAAGLRVGTRRESYAGGTLILGGDIITAINGQTVHTGDDLVSYLQLNASVGDTLTLTVIRDGAEQQVPITLAARP